MDRYAVIGNPIDHSRSPWIHARFAEMTQQRLEYSTLFAELDGFESCVKEFFASGGKGLNVTVPFKERAWAMVERHSEAAGITGAVNTLYRDQDGMLVGANTDGVGLLRDLKHNHGAALGGKRILLLGAGGAAKGVLPNLISEGPRQIVIANRTLSKAQALCKLAETTINISAVQYADIPQEAFDFVINASSATLQGQLPSVHRSTVSTHTWCYDMIYGLGDTKFQAWAKSLGAGAALDGLGMLVEQAAESFQIWRGVSPQTAPVISELRVLMAQA